MIDVLDCTERMPELDDREPVELPPPPRVARGTDASQRAPALEVPLRRPTGVPPPIPPQALRRQPAAIEDVTEPHMPAGSCGSLLHRVAGGLQRVGAAIQKWFVRAPQEATIPPFSTNTGNLGPSSHVPLSIATCPTGANATIITDGDATVLGRTPITTFVDPSRHHDVVLSKDGLVTELHPITPNAARTIMFVLRQTVR